MLALGHALNIRQGFRVWGLRVSARIKQGFRFRVPRKASLKVSSKASLKGSFWFSVRARVRDLFKEIQAPERFRG